MYLSEDHQRRSRATYIEHYKTGRPRQEIGNVVIVSREAATEGEIVCDERLGGLLKSFRRAA